MNRRTLLVFLVPVLIAVAFGPAVTSMSNATLEPRMLVSAAPIEEAAMEEARLAQVTTPVDTQWQWTSGWRTPAARNHHVMAYDATRNTSLVGEAWNYDGVTTSPGTGPIREQAASYRADQVVVVLFGSDSASTETRMYDGQTWTLHRIPGPPPRTLPATMYDAARKTVVLFGSDRAPFTRLGETREIDEQK